MSGALNEGPMRVAVAALEGEWELREDVGSDVFEPRRSFTLTSAMASSSPSESETVAWVTVAEVASMELVTRLSVAPQFRRRGVGSAVVGALSESFGSSILLPRCAFEVSDSEGRQATVTLDTTTDTDNDTSLATWAAFADAAESRALVKEGHVVGSSAEVLRFEPVEVNAMMDELESWAKDEPEFKKLDFNWDD